MNLEQKGIKNIIFDLGEVITDIHFQKTIDAFSVLAKKDVSALYNTETQTNLFDKLETGKISSDEFIEKLLQHFITNTTKEQVITAWNALIGDTPKKRLDFVNALRPKYKTFILSNTNAIHIDCVNKYLHTHYGISDLTPFFDTVYFSHVLGYRKPDAASYISVLEKENLVAEETLFIDDRQDNIEAAAKLGIQTLHLIHKEDLFRLV